MCTWRFEKQVDEVWAECTYFEAKQAYAGNQPVRWKRIDQCFDPLCNLTKLGRKRFGELARQETLPLYIAQNLTAEERKRQIKDCDKHSMAYQDNDE